MKHRSLMPFLALVAILLSGCVYTKATTKDGAQMTRISFLGNQQVGEVDLNKGTVKGYASAQSEAAAAIAEGVARGLSKP